MPKQTRKSVLKQFLGERVAFELVQSELNGIYQEMDKLCKRAPSELITKLQLKVVNSVIGKVKQLLSGDLIIEEVSIFVAAGDNPEYRDVLTILRQLLQGMDRCKEGPWRYLWDSAFKDELEEHDIDEADVIPFFQKNVND